MSNLERHAEFEMRLAGLYDADSDYAGMLPEAVLKLIRVHAAEGHSGGSHHTVMQIFNRLANFKTLTPINSNPDTWVEVSPKVWQSNRELSVFSEDGGKTWYDIEDPEKKNWPKAKQ